LRVAASVWLARGVLEQIAPGSVFRARKLLRPGVCSGNEGKKFIGNKAVSTNSNGNVTFSFVPSQAVPAGQRITATSTNSVEASTSEFSAPRTVVQ
ncbi:MAG TPA: hypothetical protein VHF70_08645, partial [Rubrobacteraceae bacterium]|nr:hypothetical protein [Rubrobacteraceae bacterium]